MAHMYLLSVGIEVVEHSELETAVATVAAIDQLASVAVPVEQMSAEQPEAEEHFEPAQAVFEVAVPAAAVDLGVQDPARISIPPVGLAFRRIACFGQSHAPAVGHCRSIRSPGLLSVTDARSQHAESVQ